jgi:hypothetical protein
MKLHAVRWSAIVRRLAIGAVPVVAVAALIGPAAGAAQAMEVNPANCQALYAAASHAWDTSHIYDYEAEQALENYDVVTYTIDNVNSAYYEQKGDDVYAEYSNLGC